MLRPKGSNGINFSGAGTLRGECGAIFHNEVGIRAADQETLDLSNGSQLSVVDNGSDAGAGNHSSWPPYSNNIVLF